MDDQSRQMRYLILIAAVLCAVVIGYNAFYVPDASFSEPAVTVGGSSPNPSSEEYTPSSVSPRSSAGAPAGGASSYASAAGSSRAPAASGGESRAAAQSAGGKININTASARQLSDGLPGIGDTIAQRIVEYRAQHGLFGSVDELKNVDGIGDKKMAQIRQSATVG